MEDLSFDRRVDKTLARYYREDREFSGRVEDEFEATGNDLSQEKAVFDQLMRAIEATKQKRETEVEELCQGSFERKVEMLRVVREQAIRARTMVLEVHTEQGCKRGWRWHGDRLISLGPENRKADEYAINNLMNAELEDMNAELDAQLEEAKERRWRNEIDTLHHEVDTLRADVESRGPGTEPLLDPVNVFRQDQDGDFWSITYEGHSLPPLKHLDGFVYIAYLLQRPNKNVSIPTLRALKDRLQLDPRHQLYEKMSREQLAEEGLSASTLNDSGEILDQQAREEYQSRLQELEAEVEEDHADPEGRVVKLEEIKALKEQLSAGQGLGGRTRKVPGKEESDRITVTMAIKKARARIKEAHNPLGDHLQKYIDTGTTCLYRPETTIGWSP